MRMRSADHKCRVPTQCRSYDVCPLSTPVDERAVERGHRGLEKEYADVKLFSHAVFQSFDHASAQRASPAKTTTGAHYDESTARTTVIGQVAKPDHKLEALTKGRNVTPAGIGLSHKLRRRTPCHNTASI